MLSWVKTFTGRILDIQGTNLFAIAKITRDWEKMYEMYCRNEEYETMELFHKIYSCYYNVGRHICLLYTSRCV